MDAVQNEPLQPVLPARPLAPWFGGKRALSKRLVGLIGQVPHDLYAEPFVGMGGVFLRRTTRPRGEVINDLSDEVVNLFRVAKEHPEALKAQFAGTFASRALFERLLATAPKALTDLQRAARFVALQRMAYGGKVVGQNFGATTGGSRYSPDKLAVLIDGIGRRMAGVMVEQLPYDRFIPRYDRPGALFFIDPPYWGCEADYGDGMFERADFERMAALLAALKGRFIMTINDRPEVRALFGQFDRKEVEVNYRISGAPTLARELIIMSKGLAAP